jgi:hypothetical protein
MSGQGDQPRRRKPRYSSKTQRKLSAAFAAVVRAAASDARTNEVERARQGEAIRRPPGASPAERNDRRLDAILCRGLPPNAAGVLHGVLDHALDILYGEFGLDTGAVRELLIERRNPERFTSTAVDPRVSDAVAVLSLVVAACEEAQDAETAKALSAAGMNSDALLSGRSAARARAKGGGATGKERQRLAEIEHVRWCADAQKHIEAGRAPHTLASTLAMKYGVHPDTMRDALVARGVLQRRRKTGAS